MNSITIRRLDVIFLPKSGRVILRPFIPDHPKLIESVLGRVLEMEEAVAVQELAMVLQEFDHRHLDLDTVLMSNYRKVKSYITQKLPLTPLRKRLIGALFSGEYALESAALFNPSIVPHPDQSKVREGDLRFVMSLRATGEGHISSIEFRTGTIDLQGDVNVAPVSRFVVAPERHQKQNYRKKQFILQLIQLGVDEDLAQVVLGALPDNFSREDLFIMLESFEKNCSSTSGFAHIFEGIHRVLDRNYELVFSDKLSLSERVIFPSSSTESNGIEDARFVKFTEEDGASTCYATYTAYNGHAIYSQLIETADFTHFRIHTLYGLAIENKGMCLFPRRIKGQFAMLSRQDDENISIMFSDNLFSWSQAEILLRPLKLWECNKMGNCGSPIETEQGWLLITHGVGPMRKYCISAVLLDLEDPRKVLGRLKFPLLSPERSERNGYVPNVVYSCGALIHGENLILPYAMSDKVSGIAVVNVAELLAELTAK